MAGANPLRWCCETQGCFNLKKRPKIEQFAECLPRACKFGDIDGLAEINGHGLLLEWKPRPIELPTGQRLTYERLTATGLLSCIVIAGDAETMIVSAIGKYFHGRWTGWSPGTLNDAKEAIRKWVSWAEGREINFSKESLDSRPEP